MIKKWLLTICLLGLFLAESYSQTVTYVAEFVLTNEFTRSALSGMETIVRSGGAAGTFRNSTPPLSTNECLPDFNEDLSSIMVSCNDEPSCLDCFSTHLTNLDFYRRQLARLRCIYNNTKTYKDNALAFGDNLSGIHPMNGLPWQKARAGILSNFQNTQRTYDAKSEEFITGLYNTLKGLDTCMYITGENNWYAKSGFIYYEFMQERYKRPD